MRRGESLSVGGIGMFCSATSCGREGGGRDCVPAPPLVLISGESMLNEIEQ